MRIFVCVCVASMSSCNKHLRQVDNATRRNILLTVQKCFSRHKKLLITVFIGRMIQEFLLLITIESRVMTSSVAIILQSDVRSSRNARCNTFNIVKREKIYFAVPANLWHDGVAVGVFFFLIRQILTQTRPRSRFT